MNEEIGVMECWIDGAVKLRLRHSLDITLLLHYFITPEVCYGSES